MTQGETHDHLAAEYAALITSVCVEVAEELGSHGAAARVAGVSPSVWSTYCSFDADKINKTIPLHRAALIEKRTGRRNFTRFFAEHAQEQDAGSIKPEILAALALQAIAKAELQLALANEDEHVTETEKRKLLVEAQRLIERAHEFAASVAGLKTGRSPLRELRAV